MKKGREKGSISRSIYQSQVELTKWYRRDIKLILEGDQKTIDLWTKQFAEDKKHEQIVSNYISKHVKLSRFEKKVLDGDLEACKKYCKDNELEYLVEKAFEQIQKHKNGEK